MGYWLDLNADGRKDSIPQLKSQRRPKWATFAHLSEGGLDYGESGIERSLGNLADFMFELVTLPESKDEVVVF